MSSRTSLTLEEKQFLKCEGYVIVRNAVSRDLVEAAQARIKRAEKGESLASDAAMTDLINRSTVTPILNDVMGQFDPPTQCQVAITKISQPSERFTPPGYRDKDVPYHGDALHMDGSITIAPPPSAAQTPSSENSWRMNRATIRGSARRTRCATCGRSGKGCEVFKRVHELHR